MLKTNLIWMNDIKKDYLEDVQKCVELIVLCTFNFEMCPFWGNSLCTYSYACFIKYIVYVKFLN